MTAHDGGAMPLDLFLRFINEEPWWEYKDLDPRRASMLTASEIGQVMSGNPEKIMRLWRIKVGDEQPEDLSKTWSAVCGIVLEGPIRHWYAMKSGSGITRRHEFVVHPLHDWFGCTLDGWDERLKCPLECKAVGGREPLEVVIERYQPQLQAQMDITGAPHAALTVAFGLGPDPITEFIARDDAYIADMIQRGEQFMQYVRNRIPPIDMPAVKPPAHPNKEYDMTGNNQWASFADAWLTSKPMADICKEAEKVLKSIVPEDGKKAYGHSVIITRDRVGRMSLRRDK